MAQTVVLHGHRDRLNAYRLIDAAPTGAVCTIKEATRSDEQNAKMWAMLSEVSRAKPEGRRWTPETWKCAFMHALGHQVQFCEGLDGAGPFPLGFRSSRLNKQQMADLITVIIEYGERHGVAFKDSAADAEPAEAGALVSLSETATKAGNSASPAPASANQYNRMSGGW